MLRRSHTSAQTPENVAFTYEPGLTGVFLTLILIIMVSTAVEQIRSPYCRYRLYTDPPRSRSYFELFWYTHHLFIAFYVLMGVHGITGFVQHQVNYQQVGSISH